ncbi:two-pore potassium channel 1-like [Cynara cardunculus var. scolymus]|uniref:two-pore potassium channel 1-like n=1 Tax=Cynara cardunculus var. scolymus TaxID=59895 RepID=UPI000D6285EA|nr:two-pore potassium channel 1-like [Cynara cardunculus var. scolymus]
MIMGTLCFYHFRHHISGKKTNSILDAFYFTAALATSIGYGDLTPDTNLVMLLVSLFGLLGMILFGLMVNMVIEIVFKPDEYDANQQTRDESDLVDDTCMTSLILFAFHMGGGTFLLHFLERMDYIKAFFCVTSTITCIDSDGCFITKSGRVFSLFWMVSGTIFIGHLLFSFMELTTLERRMSLAKLFLERRMTRAEFNAADIMQAEYILLKLKEMGRLSQKDIEPIIEELQNLSL